MNLARKIYYALSPMNRFRVRKLYYLPHDIYAFLFHKKDELEPPKGMVFVGSGDYISQGRRLAELVVKYTNLQPDGKILDIGCGIGRLAVGLTRYLNSKGTYEGFDIVDFGIDWCQKHITPKFPNFHFLFVNLKNDLYNLTTETEANSFNFPYKADSFDSIVLTSVFTHMMPKDVEHYLSQIALVMKQDGRCLATFFITNPEVDKKMAAKEADFSFDNKYEGYSLLSDDCKEANVAYEETYLRNMIDKCGLSVELMSQGDWSKGKNALDFQDVLILKKK